MSFTHPIKQAAQSIGRRRGAVTPHRNFFFLSREGYMRKISPEIFYSFSLLKWLVSSYSRADTVKTRGF